MPICNTTISYAGELGERLLRCKFLKFEEVRLHATDYIKRYQTCEKFRDLSFSIYPATDKVFLKGSWHKFHYNGTHNYNPYFLSDFSEDIDILSDLLDYDLFQGLVHSFEAGVNLSLKDLPQPYFSPDYLIPRYICYQGREPFLPMKTIRGAGQGIECQFTNYRIKIYDKGTQYHLPDPLLRFEYDCNFNREVESIGIRRLKDLTDGVKLKLLGEKLSKLYSDCLLLEPLTNPPAIEQKLFERAERPRFWRDLTRRDRSYYKQKFQQMMQTYSQHRLHSTLAKLLSIEWNCLTQNCATGKHTTRQVSLTGCSKNCNIFTPINYGKCNNEANQSNAFGRVNFNALPAFSGAVTTSPNCVVMIDSEVEEKKKLLSGQPFGRRSSRILYSHSDSTIDGELQQQHGRKQRKRTCHSEEYYLGHNKRNSKSNGPNNLRRRLNKAIANCVLFPADAVIRLTAEQMKMLSYFDGTLYQIKFSKSVLKKAPCKTGSRIKKFFLPQITTPPGGRKKRAQPGRVIWRQSLSQFMTPVLQKKANLQFSY